MRMYSSHIVVQHVALGRLQDLSASSGGPVVELFADRLQITNPGRHSFLSSAGSIRHPGPGTNSLPGQCES